MPRPVDSPPLRTVGALEALWLRLLASTTTVLLGGLVALTGMSVASASPSTSRTVGRHEARLTATVPDEITAFTSLSGSRTAIDLDPTTLTALSHADVGLTPTGNTGFTRTSVSLPITSGYLEVNSDRAVEPGWVQGSVQHDGSGLDLGHDGTVVTLANFTVDPGDSLLSATVDGDQTAVPLLFLDGAAATVTHTGHVLTLAGIDASFTPEAATVLDVALHVTAFRAGLPLGTTQLVADATADHPFPATDIAEAIAHLPGGATTIAFEPSARTALARARVTVTTSGSATQTRPTARGTVVSLPVTGGTVVVHRNHAYKPGFVDGSIPHEGSGLTFTGGGRTVTATDLVADPGDSIATATVGSNDSFPLLFLNGSNFKVQLAQLTPAAARLLDRTFSTRVFTPFMTLGQVAIVAMP